MSIKTYFFSFFFLLTVSFAGSASAQTALPQCGVHVQNIVPHVYNGTLDSFDYFYTSTETAQVLRTTVGGNVLSPRYTTTWKDTGTKFHVDVPRWFNLSGPVSIEVVLMGKDGCIETRVFTVNVPVQPVQAIPHVNTPPVSTPTQNQVTPVQTPETSISAVSATPQGQALKVVCSPTEASLTWAAQPGSTSYIVERSDEDSDFAAIKIVRSGVDTYRDTTVESGKVYTYRVRGFDGVHFTGTSVEARCGVPVNAAAPITPSNNENTCSTWPATAWVALLIVQLVLALITIDMLGALLTGNGWRFTTALFIPFAGLLSLWFVFDACRTFQWFPILVTLITLVTLFAPALLVKQSRENI